METLFKPYAFQSLIEIQRFPEKFWVFSNMCFFLQSLFAGGKSKVCVRKRKERRELSPLVCVVYMKVNLGVLFFVFLLYLFFRSVDVVVFGITTR